MVSFCVQQWMLPGDADVEKPYLFKVPNISTVVGGKEDLELLTGVDKEVPLTDDDDRSFIHSRTTNSVVLRMDMPEQLMSMIQARLRVKVKIEEEDLDTLTFFAIINVPHSQVTSTSVNTSVSKRFGVSKPVP